MLFNEKQVYNYYNMSYYKRPIGDSPLVFVRLSAKNLIALSLELNW